MKLINHKIQQQQKPNQTINKSEEDMSSTSSKKTDRWPADK